MIDVSYFQTNNANTQIFQNGNTWQTWIKPKNAKTVNFFVVGAGAGGGGGFQAGTGAIGGGGGGGNGGYTKLLVQASILPDILYILPGAGGAGGTGGSSAIAGSSGNKSYVCLIPDITSVSNIVCTSGTAAAIGGGAGTTALGSGGSGETAATATGMIFANLGNFLGLAGQLAGAGGTAGANSVTALFAFNLAAGGGGGSGTGAGITGGTTVVPTVASTPINTSGKNGFVLYKPIFVVTGGNGGGGGTNGGNGGNGAPGCGGGGGGAGTGTAGNGGNGGDGFVIITTNF